MQPFFGQTVLTDVPPHGCLHRARFASPPPSQACIESSLKVVSVLLQNGANVNATDNDWWTPLHAAAACDHWRIVSVLLQNGADVSMVNADGDLAVDLAEDGKTKQGLEAEMARQGQCGDRQIFRLH